MFEEAIPPQYREGMDGAIGSKEVERILSAIAEKNPKDYKDVSFALLRLGTKGSVETNTSFSLDDLKSPLDKAQIIADMRTEEGNILSDKTTDRKSKDERLTTLYQGVATSLPDKVFTAAMDKGSNLARMVASGARGNKSQLNSNIGADILVSDSKGRPVLMPIVHNYSEGLSPAEYFAASFGTRLGLLATKFAVQDSGFFAKQLSAAASDIVVTSKDCKTQNGIPTDPGDSANVGSLLARPAAGHPAGTVITPKIAGELARSLPQGQKIVVRSPLACSARHGICSKCAGIREHGHLPALSENVGLAAASGISEPVSQSLLSTKHSAGVASAGGGSNVTGFPSINALSQVPRIYPGGSVVTENDGRVRKIEKAPQGGWSVTVGDWTGHVPPGREVSVKEGDELEAGDAVSTGVPSPADIVRLKGVGAGRKYWVDAMMKNLSSGGTKIDRRNLEVMARAVVNHVEAGDDVDTSRHLPGDVLEYGAWQAGYRRASDTSKATPVDSVGRFMQSPALHYTIGTRITPSVAKDLASSGIDAVDSSETEPDFKPRMIRLMDSPAYKDDWMTHTGQSYAKRNLKWDIQEGGATSMLHGIHMAPSLAKGVEFGRPGPGKIGY